MKICASSAYCLILNSFLPIFIPSIFVLFLIFCAKISAHKINIYGESGHPWRTPRSKEKYSELQPLLVTQLLMSVLSILTHCFIRGGKLNFSRHWYINGHSKVSNAFSKSTEITSADIFSSWAKYIKSIIVVIFDQYIFLLENRSDHSWLFLVMLFSSVLPLVLRGFYSLDSKATEGANFLISEDLIFFGVKHNIPVFLVIVRLPIWYEYL